MAYRAYLKSVCVGRMKHVLIFLMRVVIFHAILLCKLYVRNQYHLEYTLDTQLLLSCLQMCLVCSGIVLYRLCTFIVYTISDGLYYNTIDDRDREMGEKDVELDDVVCTEQTVRVDVVVFADARALGIYVWKIHATGLLLWGTFYSFDLSTGLAYYSFVVGLLVGWLGRLWQTGRGAQAGMLNVTLCFVYTALYTAILAINQPVVDGWSVQIAMYGTVLPVLFGVAWMAFAEHPDVMQNSESAAVTCLLMCVLIMSTSDWVVLRAMLACERVLFVYLLVFEPFAKFLALYIIVLSVYTRHKQQILFVFVSVYALACVAFCSHMQVVCKEPDTAQLYTTSAAITILFVIQLVRICRQEPVNPK